MSTGDIEAYHDARADAWAGVEVVAEDNAESVRARTVELLLKPQERDPEVWDAYFDYHEIDDEWFDDPLEVLNLAPEHERDKGWHAIVTAFGDAAYAQAYVEIMMVPIVKEMQQGTTKVTKTLGKLGKGEIRKVGSTGRARFDAAKKKKRDGGPTEDS